MICLETDRDKGLVIGIRRNFMKHENYAQTTQWTF